MLVDGETTAFSDGMTMKIIVDADEVTVDPTGRPSKRDGQPIAAHNRTASGQHGGVIRGRREQITLNIPRELLVAVDMLARRMRQTRAALINRAIYELLEQNRP
jgi:Ribbon-helix-helix protein, copG family